MNLSIVILLLVLLYMQADASDLTPISVGFKSALCVLKRHSILNHGSKVVQRNNKPTTTLICRNKIKRNSAIDDSEQVETYIPSRYNHDDLSATLLVSRETINRKSSKTIETIDPITSTRPLTFWENMICGAVSRTVSQTVMHPANTMKTILQAPSHQGETRATVSNLARFSNIKLLTRGAGAQFILSIPNGAINFAVLEFVRNHLNQWVEERHNGGGFLAIGPGLDFLSSAISTICCSLISTPQTVVVDNIMAGTYPNMVSAVSEIGKERGVIGFYRGWSPSMIGKIPSFGLTWVFFQQLKRAQLQKMQRSPNDIENSIMGAIASGATVIIMMPMDTIKTRLVTQRYNDYNGILNCAIRISKEEGMSAFYRGLVPRLASVTPMVGIQFGVYEFMKKIMLTRDGGVNGDKRGENKNGLMQWVQSFLTNGG